ncbi:hypothetical protein [Dongia deserti]|uniref:hypothetical protein n=1 Tax=Dongia deserti TaxID=2268030 RepID=UPI000E6570B6|nr:hypothetical protein [Dongia deserti]
MGLESTQAFGALLVREPTEPEIEAMMRARTKALVLRLDGFTAATVLMVLQRAQREHGINSTCVTQVAWLLRDLVIEIEPELHNLIDSGWAGVPLQRSN